MKPIPIKTLVFLLMLITQLGYWQQRIIKGIVKDSEGLPLPGVNLLVKETRKSSQTNFDGEFYIEAEINQTLLFSFIGKKTKEVKAAAAPLTVRLEPETTELEKIIVTAMGIKRKLKT